MSNGIYTGYYDTYIALSKAHKKVTITSSGTIDVPSGNAVQGGMYYHAYTVLNQGSISTDSGIGVYLEDGGSVTNGGKGSTAALIYGDYDGVSILNAAGTVTNSGIISSDEFGEGVYLGDGGSVINGAKGDTEALVYGYNGVIVSYAAGTVTNDGSIESSAYGRGIYLEDGGSVTNGAKGDTAALIYGGYDGVIIGYTAGKVTNDGSIITGEYGTGVYLEDGGSVTNGAKGDTVALIYGDNGVIVLGSAGTVTNDGAIEGRGFEYYYSIIGGKAVYLAYGGSVVNGDSAEILGFYDGVVINGAAGTVTNDGTIAGEYQNAVILDDGGSVINGDKGNTEAVVVGHNLGIGIYSSSGTVTNFGTIENYGTGADVYLRDGGNVTNGAHNSTAAIIEGFFGVVDFAGTITNFGTIAGYIDAVEFYGSDTAADRVIDEVGSTFYGGVYGGGASSVLELASSSHAGTVSGLGYQFTGFGTITVDSGAQWDVTGDNTVLSGVTLSNAGKLTIESGGVLDTAAGGALSKAGKIEVQGGTLDLGVSVSSAKLNFSGSGGLIELTQGGTYTGISIQDIQGGDTIALTSQAWAAGDQAVYAHGTIKLETSGGALLDAFAATTKGAGVTGFDVVDLGGSAAIEALPPPVIPAVVDLSGFDQARTGDSSALLDNAHHVGGFSITDHHAGQTDIALSIRDADHS